MNLVLAGLCSHIYGVVALFGYFFIADAAPQNKLALRLLILGIPCYFIVLSALQAFGLSTRWHQAYTLSFLLSVLTLMISVIKRKYFLWACGEVIVSSFYGSVIVLGSLSLYIAISTFNR
ncbi:hypothetical protein ACE1AT_14890 [Pelatocladus sp. BLCC-F211]|uniref:hypothetical protein n=1 Tax=Pelatocladus sp. BLCC-F211 TaxID=3342752 RepID=UPI0035B746C2